MPLWLLLEVQLMPFNSSQVNVNKFSFAVSLKTEEFLPLIPLNNIDHLIRRIPINYLLMNLAAVGIIYSVFLVPTLILKHKSAHPVGVTGRVLCWLLTGGNFAWIGAASEVVTLVAIAVERYYAVRYPHGNKGKLTTPKRKVCHSNNKLAKIVELQRSPLVMKNIIISWKLPRSRCLKADLRALSGLKFRIVRIKMKPSYMLYIGTA